MRLATDISESHYLVEERRRKMSSWMCSDSFCVSKRVFCVSRTRLHARRSSCFLACGVRSHRVTLACQSIKWRGPVSHQGAMHDCRCSDAQKFAPPPRESPLRGKDSSVTQTTVPIHNDRCAVWLKWLTAQCRRLNSKYMWGRWRTAGRVPL